MKKILRVFPHKNSYVPSDALVRIGCQTLALPQHDEIHISCVFTWDMPFCEYLKKQYEAVTDKPVFLGGPAYASPSGGFIPGLYVKNGITFTSRGCNNNCKFCFVREREGKLVEIEIQPGNIIQDNNFLQCSKEHQQKVFDMLETQRRIEFRGGLQSSLVDEWFAERVTVLQREHRLKCLWFACDTESALEPLEKAIYILRSSGFNVNPNSVQCYALSYGDPQQREEDEHRFKEIFSLGCMPRVQLFRKKEKIKTVYPKKTEQWLRTWQRPAIIRAICKAKEDEE